MSTTWSWYADAGGTVPLTRGDFARGSVSAAVDRIVYFMSPATGKKLQRATLPGTNALQVKIDDVASGSGVEVANIKLALSSGGLGSATGGAALSIGTTLLSGAAGAVAVFVRLTSAITAAGNYDDAGLYVEDYLETDV
ncbi:MAG: hypothetical protein Q7J47_03370 [Azoarcus sp.]|nr:hypothetical protein [Azoarcus sp.]